MERDKHTLKHCTAGMDRNHEKPYCSFSFPSKQTPRASLASTALQHLAAKDISRATPHTGYIRIPACTWAWVCSKVTRAAWTCCRRWEPSMDSYWEPLCHLILKTILQSSYLFFKMRKWMLGKYKKLGYSPTSWENLKFPPGSASLYSSESSITSHCLSCR